MSTPTTEKGEVVVVEPATETQGLQLLSLLPRCAGAVVDGSRALVRGISGYVWW